MLIRRFKNIIITYAAMHQIFKCTRTKYKAAKDIAKR